jgi:hypothetical protein
VMMMNEYITLTLLSYVKVVLLLLLSWSVDFNSLNNKLKTI